MTTKHPKYTKPTDSSSDPLISLSFVFFVCFVVNS